MSSLVQRYNNELKKIIKTQQLYGNRVPVSLLAVSKTKPAEDIISLYQAGQRDFGENYLQEAILKQKKLSNYAISWHFIGPIQSNKTRELARSFSWVHTVDRLKIAQRLQQQRPDHLPALNICLQVNIDQEESKSGLNIDNLDAIIEPILSMNRLRLRGLMAIPKVRTSFEQQREPFKRLAELKDKLNNTFNIQLDTLSIGMSADLEAAICEGSTMVRIGTAIFGSRKKTS